jgi:outer membrane protein assembly factor BamD (BamD/ComL family)
MSIKEQIVQELNGLSQAELEEIAQYLAFIKYQSRVKPTPVSDEAQMAALYAEFAEEDRQLAEEGISDYTRALAKEDAE